jgi:hypothetical protein
MAVLVNMGGVDCPPEMEAEFNRWYDEVHIPMLLESGEIKKVTRLQRVGNEANYPKFLVIYEFEDRQAFERYEKSQAKTRAMAEMKLSWPRGGPVQRRWRVQYDVIGTSEK